MSGWCGLASGQGTLVQRPTARFAFVAVGPFIILTGGVVGIVNAAEDPLNNTPGPGDECNENKGGGEKHFLITGGAAIFDHCAVKNKGTTNVVLPGTLTTILNVLTNNLLTISSHITGTFTIFTKACAPDPVL